MSFTVETFQNRYLAPGQTRIDAILSVTASAAATGGELVVGFIIDKSGSMNGDRIKAVTEAVGRAISLLDERARFFVVAFDTQALPVVPETVATPDQKQTAAQALARLSAGGGTAMSQGLAAARALFERHPDAIRQAVFLTDGKNESERPGTVAAELARCEGVFECDCWGVGTDWHVGEVQEIAKALLGKASLLPEPQAIYQAFQGAMEKASAKAVKDVRLRLWTPQGAEVVFVKQVNPTIEELTGKAKIVSPQVREYLTGSWGSGESRDFHLAVEVKIGKVGDEMLAARPSLVYLTPGPSGWSEQEEKPAAARLFANWTADDALSSRIDHHVAHYTGQDELASAIQQGLEAREQGKEALATQLLGRAVQIANDSHNTEMTQRLAKVVEVVDAPRGTVRLKKNVQKAAAMELQLESHTTKRSRKKAEGEGSGGAER
jgi:Mg-chelatase subunit ChlD